MKLASTGWALGFLGLAACGGPVGDGDGIVTAEEVPGPGWSAVLRTHNHDVAGTAFIVDDNTIEIRDTVYDGGGVNSQWYLFPDGGSDGFSISENQVGDAYNGETLTLSLPDDVDFEQFNLISLWCVPFDVSFGDGVFMPPETDGVIE